MPDISINQERCTRCGACIALCTGRVFDQSDGRVDVVDAASCWLCGHCVAACPSDAISHAAYPLEECPHLDPATLPSQDSLLAALRERRSHRVFRNKPVPREILRALVDHARWAPSAGNDQPIDWLVFDDAARIAQLSALAVDALARTARLLRNPWLRPFLTLALGAGKVRAGLESAASFERLAEKHAAGLDPIFHGAPVVLMAHSPRGAYFGRDDATYSVYNLMLTAQRLGLGTCHIGYVMVALERSRHLRESLGLPEDREVQIALALGYPRYPFRRAVPRRQPNLRWNPSNA
jgi:nitroreductase/NAD-dependent dihydropyrimidine dehydrogenase PreA subunit